MAKRTDPPINGILLLDKPQGLTSHDVILQIRRKLGMKAVGHSGTLDPLASGLMVILLGQATRLSPYLLGGNKTYEVCAKLGVLSDTWDIDTAEDKIRSVDPDLSVGEAALIKAIDSLNGMNEWQVPPISAVKVKGRKLYEYARAGEDVPVVHKPMTVFESKYLGKEGANFRAKLEVSKGTFVRSWVMEVAKLFGTSGVVTDLRRLVSAPYKVDDAISLSAFMNLDKPLESGSFLGMPETLPHWPRYHVRGKWERLVTNGAIPHGMNWEICRIVDENPDAQGVQVLSGESGELLSLLVSRKPGNKGGGNVGRNKVKVACVFK